MRIIHKPYWALHIAKCEERYNARYMGPWALKSKSGDWSDRPWEIFYANDPDTSKGHTHYFGLIRYGTDGLMITKGDSAFSEDIVGAYSADGTVCVSRYRHDFVEHGAFFIDGGRDYTRLGGKPGEDFKTIKIFADGPDLCTMDDLGNVEKLTQVWEDLVPA